MKLLREPRALLVVAVLAGCGGGEGGSGSTSTTGGAGGDGGGGGGGPGEAYALHVKIALTDDGQGVSLFTQNGSTVHVPKADIVGKSYIWATTPGGEPVGNTKPIDFGIGKMGDDLTAEFTTPKKYPDGPWEMAVVVSVTGSDPTKGPQPGDLAGFDLSDPPKGDPPVTGVSVRMKVHGADASITLDNKYFIRF